jgi:hypothetical protein
MTTLDPDLDRPHYRRGTPMPADEARSLDELATRHGIISVARAADCSVQSVAKAIAGRPLYDSTKRRLRTVLGA